MCGIVGTVSSNNLRSFLINGLKSLEYRGYDSAGIATISDNKFELFRSVGRVELLTKKLPTNLKGTIGIGHTRWATHGEPLEKNCHPLTSFHDLFTIVHNGVIENFQELKSELINNGYEFSSDTDTEVIVNILDQEYLKTNNILDAISNSLKRIEGSLAIAILFKNDSSRLYFAKRKSPLLVGIGKDTNYLASDALPMINYANKFVDLTNDEYGYISKSEVHVYKNNIEQKLKYTERNAELLNADLNGYPHYMLKEIEEIPSCIMRLIDNYFQNSQYKFNSEMLEALLNADTISFIACGTSYHACLLGKHYMEKIGKHSEAYIASEWAYFPHFNNREKEIFILVSQSGETADVITCLQTINKNNYKSITITNTKGSTLERDATWSCLLYAGVEIAVASTKAYASQVALLYLLSSAIVHNTSSIKILKDNNVALDNIISIKEEIKEIAYEIKDVNNAFFLGRGTDYYVALEASLKLKEITYIHSEAFPGGELKHGPLALVEKNTPIFGFITLPEISAAMRGNFSEVKARNAKVYSFVTKNLASKDDTIIIDNLNRDISALAIVMVAQYLAYYTALARNNDIDKPRNLAKSVTVE